MFCFSCYDFLATDISIRATPNNDELVILHPIITSVITKHIQSNNAFITTMTSSQLPLLPNNDDVLPHPVIASAIAKPEQMNNTIRPLRTKLSSPVLQSSLLVQPSSSLVQQPSSVAPQSSLLVQQPSLLAPQSSSLVSQLTSQPNFSSHSLLLAPDYQTNAGGGTPQPRKSLKSNFDDRSSIIYMRMWICAGVV